VKFQIILRNSNYTTELCLRQAARRVRRAIGRPPATAVDYHNRLRSLIYDMYVTRSTKQSFEHGRVSLAIESLPAQCRRLPQSLVFAYIYERGVYLPTYLIWWTINDEYQQCQGTKSWITISNVQISKKHRLSKLYEKTLQNFPTHHMSTYLLSFVKSVAQLNLHYGTILLCKFQIILRS